MPVSALGGRWLACLRLAVLFAGDEPNKTFGIEGTESTEDTEGFIIGLKWIFRVSFLSLMGSIPGRGAWAAMSRGGRGVCVVGRWRLLLCCRRCSCCTSGASLSC